MSKELPYFRFTVSEWLQDDISLENYEIKGVFADVCAYYWFKDCSIGIATLMKRFSNASESIDYLIELEIIKVINDDLIEIKFLNEQFDLLSEKRQKYIDAGRIGGLKRASNAKATLKQRSSYKDKDKDKENNKDNDKRKNPFHSEMKTVFMDFYKFKSGTEYYWTGKDANQLNLLTNKLKKKIEESEQDITCENIIHIFGILLKKLPKWYIENGLTPAIINSKFNEIVIQIKNKQQNGKEKSNFSEADIDDYFANKEY